MNSMSKGYYDPCRKEIEEDNHKRENKEDRECRTIIKCGTPSSATIPAATPARTTFSAGSLTLNTSSLRNPCIKLEYASNLIATGFTGTVSFQVFKLCNNQLTPLAIGPAWIFSISGAAVTAATTFSFFVCDCDSCFKECCNYTVVATVTSATTAGTLNINNATLGAIATCNENRCC